MPQKPTKLGQNQKGRIKLCQKTWLLLIIESNQYQNDGRRKAWRISRSQTHHTSVKHGGGFFMQASSMQRIKEIASCLILYAFSVGGCDMVLCCLTVICTRLFVFISVLFSLCTLIFACVSLCVHPPSLSVCMCACQK